MFVSTRQNNNILYDKFGTTNVVSSLAITCESFMAWRKGWPVMHKGDIETEKGAPDDIRGRHS